tara:strand:- start:83 stop:466 length:384 start_codon:yes stop_codon:yes gene_type:complete
MRTPRYGELDVVHMPAETYRIWLTRDDELPELPSHRWSSDYETDLSEMELRDQIEALLNQIKFTRQESRAIALYIFSDLTMEETGKHMKVTKERIRQILAKSMRKCRSPYAAEGVWEPVPQERRKVQ